MRTHWKNPDYGSKVLKQGKPIERWRRKITGLLDASQGVLWQRDHQETAMRHVTVSRRLVMAKVKTKPAPSEPKPPHRGSNNAANRVGGSSSLRPFKSISSPRAPPAPGWKNWQIATLTIIATAMALAAIYLLARNSLTDNERPVTTQKFTIEEPPVINIRPMRASSAQRTMIGRSGTLGAKRAENDPGQDPARSNSDKKTAEGRYSDGLHSHARDEADYPALDLDRRHALVLPTDVSGNCDIGDNGIKDLGSCLARNGARTK